MSIGIQRNGILPEIPGENPRMLMQNVQRKIFLHKRLHFIRICDTMFPKQKHLSFVKRQLYFTERKWIL